MTKQIWNFDKMADNVNDNVNDNDDVNDDVDDDDDDDDGGTYLLKMKWQNRNFVFLEGCYEYKIAFKAHSHRAYYAA